MSSAIRHFVRCFTSGRLVIKPGSWNLSASPFCEGLALVQVEGWYGFIDETGAFAIRPQYWRAGGFSEGLAPVRNREKWGFIDKTGRMVIEPQFDWVRKGFWEGMAQVHDDREWWFIDRTGKKTIKLPSAAIRVFRGGLAWAAVGRKRGYIDKTGKWVWEPSEQAANGLAASRSDGRVDGWGLGAAFEVIVFDGRTTDAQERSPKSTLHL